MRDFEKEEFMRRNPLLDAGLLFLVIFFLGFIALTGYFETSSQSQLAQVSGCPNTLCSYGFGRNATGGTGYPVVYVTTLEDSQNPIIPGSLRAAVSAGNRIIKFQVSGNIELKNSINLKYPNVTIDGSDAPNGGISITKEPLIVETDNVVIRHIRLRGAYDGLAILGGSNILIDHVSCSWAEDECMSIAGYSYTGTGSIRNVTIQNSLISEMVPPHDYGFLADGDFAQVTWYRNVFAKNGNRNPQLTPGIRHDGTGSAGGIPSGARINGTGYYDLVQNIIYDAVYGTRIANYSEGWTTKLDVIGNYWKLGPKFPNPKIPVGIFQPPDSPESLGPIKVYLADNSGGPVRPDYTGAGCDYFSMPLLFKPCGGWEPDHSATTRQVTTHSFPPGRAQDNYNEIAANAGATLPCRDSVDTRVIEEMRVGISTAVVPSVPNLSLPCPGTTPPATTVTSFTLAPSLEGSPLISRSFGVTIHTQENGSIIAAKNLTGTNSLSVTGLSLNPAAYDLYVTTPGFLRKKLSTTLSQNGNYVIPTLSAGDLNTDNIINSLDWSTMSGQWGTANTQSDVNRDGIVNSIDFSFLNKNWMQVGD